MLDFLAEQRIAEAMKNGEFEELRLAYRILKNAGHVPPEVRSLNQIAELERLVNGAPQGERLRLLKKIALLRTAAESREDRRPARTSRRRG